MPSTALDETSSTDVGFWDLFGVVGLDQSKLKMWSSHWKDPKRRPQRGPFWDLSSPFLLQFSCMPNATSEQTGTPDVGFGDFFGVGGLDQSKLMMLWSHWKDPKRGPQRIFWILPDR